MAGKFDGYGERQGQKKGGIHAADPDGGRYKLQKSLDETDDFLIKRDTEKGENDIAEYLASCIFQTTAPGYGAEVTLAKNTSNTPENPDNQNAFLVSKYFKNYKDFFQDLSIFKERGNLLTTLEAFKIQSTKGKLATKTKEGKWKYTDYEQSLVTSLLVGDFSVHSGNMGVISKDGDDQKKLVRIDFGAAFRDFTPEINPYKSVKNRMGYEKNYFLRDHPKERIISKEFSDELRKVGSQDLDVLIEGKWDDIDNNFDQKTIKAFGAQLGLGKSATSENIRRHLTETFKKRQQSLIYMANEIDIGLAMKIEDPKRRVELIKAVDRAVQESPDHFQSVLVNSKESQLKIKYSKEVLLLLQAGLSKHETNKAVLSDKSHDDITVNTLSNQIDSSARKLQSSAIDPITLIRQEVINKQNDILKEAIGIHPEISNMRQQEFKKYLANPANKETVEEAFKRSAIKLQKAEIDGYKKFNEEFAKISRPVAWDTPSSNPGEKLQVVKNAEEEEICTLSEKTVELSGSAKDQKLVARMIEFPLSIKKGSGPMHASFALYQLQQLTRCIYPVSIHN
jgi:hypothetical protein